MIADIIFRDETDFVFCFLGCVAWLGFRHANLTAGGEERVRILAIACVSFSLVFLSLPTVLAFFFCFFFLRSNAHTHINKEGANTLGKAERRQTAARFTQFLNYRFV